MASTRQKFPIGRRFIKSGAARDAQFERQGRQVFPFNVSRVGAFRDLFRVKVNWHLKREAPTIEKVFWEKGMSFTVQTAALYNA